MAKKIEDKDKIKALLRYYKTTQTEFAARLGVSQSGLSHWVTRNKLPMNVIHKIADVCEEVSFSWLITGLGPMLTINGGLTEEQMTNGFAESEEKLAIIPGLDCDEFIQCSGFSMEPTIHASDFIGLKNIQKGGVVDPESIYLVTTDDNTKMLRYVACLEEEDMYELTTDSTRRALKISKDKVKKLQRVVFTGRMI